MTYQELIDLIVVLKPGAHWNLKGYSYNDLEWLDDPSTKPSAADLGLDSGPATR